MAKKLKIYAMGTPWGGSKTIATTSAKLAAEAFGTTLHSFRMYGGETGHRESIEAAMERPNQALIQRRRSLQGAMRLAAHAIERGDHLK